MMLRRRSLGRCWLAAAAFCWMSAFAARAQGDLIDREVRAAPGRDVRIGIYTNIRSDCTSGPLPAIRLVTAPVHGSVSVKRGILKATNFRQCLGIEAPAFVAFYRATAEFSGPDVFELEISTQDGRKQHQRVRVIVTKPAGAGDSI